MEARLGLNWNSDLTKEKLLDLFQKGLGAKYTVAKAGIGYAVAVARDGCAVRIRLINDDDETALVLNMGAYPGWKNFTLVLPILTLITHKKHLEEIQADVNQFIASSRELDALSV